MAATGLEDTWSLVIGLLHFGVADMKAILVILCRELVVGERSGAAAEEVVVVAMAIVLSVRMNGWLIVKKGF